MLLAVCKETCFSKQPRISNIVKHCPKRKCDLSICHAVVENKICIELSMQIDASLANKLDSDASNGSRAA